MVAKTDWGGDAAEMWKMKRWKQRVTVEVDGFCHGVGSQRGRRSADALAGLHHKQRREGTVS